jgi:S1-C subfamily serine protease
LQGEIPVIRAKHAPGKNDFVDLFGFELNPTDGVVTKVVAGSPADAAGLRTGDRVD